MEKDGDGGGEGVCDRGGAGGATAWPGSVLGGVIRDNGALPC
jgi:hypothetical protein